MFGFDVLYFETSTLNQFYTQFVVTLVLCCVSVCGLNVLRAEVAQLMTRFAKVYRSLNINPANMSVLSISDTLHNLLFQKIQFIGQKNNINFTEGTPKELEPGKIVGLC